MTKLDFLIELANEANRRRLVIVNANDGDIGLVVTFTDLEGRMGPIENRPHWQHAWANEELESINATAKEYALYFIARVADEIRGLPSKK